MLLLGVPSCYLYFGPDGAHGRDGREGSVGGAGHLLQRRRRQRVRSHGVGEDSHVRSDFPVEEGNIEEF